MSVHKTPAMSADREALVAEVAGVVRWHALHTSMNICTCRAWRAKPDAGSLAEQHAAHLADALADLLAAREQQVRAEAWDEGHRLTRPHSDHCEPTCPNPYREADARPRSGSPATP